MKNAVRGRVIVVTQGRVKVLLKGKLGRLTDLHPKMFSLADSKS